MKALKSKTIIAAVIIAVIGAANGIAESSFIPAEAVTWIMMGIGVLQAVLRTVTTKPLSEK